MASLPFLDYGLSTSVHWNSAQLRLTSCPMCSNGLKKFDDKYHGSYYHSQKLKFCRTCGWWVYDYFYEDTNGDSDEGFTQAAKLVELRPDDKKLPEEQLLLHLKNNPKLLRSINPYKFEEVIQKIYQEVYGYRAILTLKSRDKGIDMYVFDANDSPAIVQIKQSQSLKKPVSVSVLRELVGVATIRNYDSIHLVTNYCVSRDCRLESDLLGHTLQVSFKEFEDLSAALELLPQHSKALGWPDDHPLWIRNLGSCLGSHH